MVLAVQGVCRSRCAALVDFVQLVLPILFRVNFVVDFVIVCVVFGAGLVGIGLVVVFVLVFRGIGKVDVLEFVGRAFAGVDAFLQQFASRALLQAFWHVVQLVLTFLRQFAIAFGNVGNVIGQAAVG